MGSYNQTGRLKKQYISDYPELEVHPLNCVPDDRPHGSWTNGVKAWKRGDSGSSDTVMGWFFPPRHRNKGWKTRKSRQTHYNQFTHPLDEIQEEE